MKKHRQCPQCPLCFLYVLSALTSCPLPLKWTFSKSVRRAGSPRSEINLKKKTSNVNTRRLKNQNLKT